MVSRDMFFIPILPLVHFFMKIHFGFRKNIDNNNNRLKKSILKSITGITVISCKQLLHRSGNRSHKFLYTSIYE